ncbi:MAG: HAMP domain-containing histidine kinase [Acidobacteria bacterium]|nr:HAMP domain-containing histidine kinase [Acidobacteriota bacterium]
MNDLLEENQRLRGERDLLRRKLAEVEENFLRTVQESQQEILVINEALAQANSQLQELDRMKDAFLSMVTHELRTPLTAISGITEMLETGIYGELTREQAEHISQIATQATRLRQLVNDLLDLSKMEAGMMKLRREMFDPRSLVEAVIEQLTTLAQRSSVLLRNHVLQDLPEAYCDGRRIEQVLTNLVTNAIKFTPPGGQVIITGESRVLTEGVKIFLCVADTGQGIPPEALPRIFDKFFQVQSSTETRTKGTGLGLAIVKHIVELHGGEVSVESQLGKGSRFFFSLRTTDCGLRIADCGFDNERSS